MEQEYWTTDMVAYLRAHYKTVGDTELAEYFEATWPKNKPWTRKHIEKKRRYLQLSRTQRQQYRIWLRNKQNGRFKQCAANMWATRGIAAEGDIRWWNKRGRTVPMIKVGGRFQHWARWAWEQAHGPVAVGMNVVFIQPPTPTNLTLQNLRLMTNAEVAVAIGAESSGALSDNYILGMLRLSPEQKASLKTQPELIELKRNLLKINRIIKNGRTRTDH